MRASLKQSKLTRADKAEAISKVLLATALKSIATNGVDLTSIQSVAADAQTSTGAVYSRYESVDDLISVLWEEKLDRHLANLLELVRLWCGHGNQTAKSALIAELSRPSLNSVALVEVLAVVRRYPMSAEIVRGRVTALLRHHIKECAKPAGQSMPQVAVLLGALLLHPVLPRTDQDSAEVLLDMLSEMFKNASALKVPSVKPKPYPISLPRAENNNGQVEQFSNAAFQVIARTGFEKASANRIAREAGKGFAGIYKEFGSKEDFMEDITSSLVKQFVSLSITPFVGASKNKYLEMSVSNAKSLTCSENRLMRYLRLEIIVAARHHQRIKRSLKTNFEESSKHLHMIIAKEFGMTSERAILDADALWVLLRVNGVGIPLIRSSSAYIDEIDWTPASAALYDLLKARGFMATKSK